MENVKKIKTLLWIYDYKITFEYDTKRNNHKSQERIISATAEENAKISFWIWINSMNTDKPYRAMSNVKILDIEKIGKRSIEI